MLSEIEVIDANEKISVKADSLITNTSIIKSDEHIHNEDTNIESSTTDVHMHEMDHPLVANIIPDNVISDILNQSSDSIFLQALNDNSSNIDSIEFDETSLLSEGGHIAMLQEVSTIGFELLIDSETKQNSILAELLTSQSNLIGSDDDLSDEDNFITIQFNHNNVSELQEAIANMKPTGNSDVEFNADDVETGDTEFDSDEHKTGDTEFDSDEDKPEDTDFDSDEGKIENGEFDSDEGKIENGELNSDEDKTENTNFGSDEDKTENIDFGSDEDQTEDTELGTDEIKNMHNESELSDSVPDGKVTEISDIEPEDPRCPDPGWCIFWFAAIDLCAKDSHCHGSLLCCTIGCSKSCVDPDDDLL